MTAHEMLFTREHLVPEVLLRAGHVGTLYLVDSQEQAGAQHRSRCLYSLGTMSQAYCLGRDFFQHRMLFSVQLLQTGLAKDGSIRLAKLTFSVEHLFAC